MIPTNSYPVLSWPSGMWPIWGNAGSYSIIKNYATEINYLLNFETSIESEISMITSIETTLDYVTEV